MTDDVSHLLHLIFALRGRWSLAKAPAFKAFRGQQFVRNLIPRSSSNSSKPTAGTPSSLAYNFLPRPQHTIPSTIKKMDSFLEDLLSNHNVSLSGDEQECSLVLVDDNAKMPTTPVGFQTQQQLLLSQQEEESPAGQERWSGPEYHHNYLMQPPNCRANQLVTPLRRDSMDELEISRPAITSSSDDAATMPPILPKRCHQESSGSAKSSALEDQEYPVSLSSVNISCKPCDSSKDGTARTLTIAQQSRKILFDVNIVGMLASTSVLDSASEVQ